MKISTEIGSLAKIVGEEKAVEYVAKAGFDAWDFSMFCMCNYDYSENKFIKSSHPLASDDYLSFALKLKKIADDNGIVCNQSHAPYSSCCAEIRSYHKRAIECTAAVGGKICIIHPDHNKSAEENAEMYMELLPFAKECGVKIAAENMFNWKDDDAIFAACATPESFAAHLDAVGDDYLIACLDIGHAEMRGVNTSAVDMIKALGSRLQALHIHDNDKIHDSHQIPFSMNIDFEKVLKALKNIGYSGYLTLEADRYLSDYNEDNVFEGVLNLASAARKLAEMYNRL